MERIIQRFGNNLTDLTQHYVELEQREDRNRRDQRSAGAIWAESKKEEGFKIPVTTVATCMPDALFTAMKLLKPDYDVKVDMIRRRCR